MKRIITLALVLSCGVAMAQKSDNVGIGTKIPDPSALLDLNSTSKGLLIPRMNQTQRDAIKDPAVGLMIFQTDKSIGVYTYDGTTWTPSNARTAATQVAGAWDKQGNSVDGTDFIGTTNTEPLRFKVNGTPAGFISLPSSFNTFLGASTPASTIAGVGNSGFGTNALGSVTSSNNNTAVGANSQRLTTAGSNTSMGSASLYTNTGGGSNTAVGVSAMFSNEGGFGNVGVGVDALRANVGGFYNMAIGYAALYTNIAGSDNMGIGTEALRFATGSRNTAVGTWAGRGTAPYAGSNNVFIGYGAGSPETGSGKLYIANSETTTPLIKGDFTNNNLKFHTGTTAPTATAGFVAIGDFSANGSTATPGTGAINTFPAFTGSSQYRLIVQDGILTEKIKVALRNGSDWADYVFAPDYKLMPLEDVEQFTKENKHLPNVPSADDMVKDGLDVTKTSAKLMEKIEELTLYVIEMNKEIKALKEENKKMRDK